MSFLYNNMTAVAVAAVASTLAWLFGGARGDWLLPVVPWLFALLIEIMVCFPQRHATETTYEARERVWRAMRRSPVVWLSLVTFVLLLVPFVNNGLCPGCDVAKISQGIDPAPPAPFLPFCVNRLDHLDVVMWFAMALLSVVAVHHSLTRRGKRLTLALIVWNGAALAAFGFLQGAMGAEGPFWTVMRNGKSAGAFFSTFGYPNMAGAYFTMLFGIAVALWRDTFEAARREEAERATDGDAAAKPYGRFWRKHYFLLPAAVVFFAALNTLSRAAIVLVTALACLFFVHTLVVSLSRLRKSRRVFVGVWSLLVFGLVIFFSTVFMPQKLRREVNSLEAIGMLDRVTGRSEKQSSVAIELWKDHPLFGCGGWGFSHFARLKLPPKDRSKISTFGGANVHNDYLQFLVEHGLAVVGLLLALCIVLLWPVFAQWRRRVRELRFAKGHNLPPKPIALFAMPAPVTFILLTVCATLVHAFGDCPLRSSAVLTLLFVEIAAVSGFLPKRVGGGSAEDAAAGERRRHHHRHHDHSEEKEKEEK